VWSDSAKPADIHLNLRLRRFDEQSEADFNAQVGLLLLVLKDLWTGDLPIGGESSVGRGRLRGVEATIAYDRVKWIIKQSDKDNLTVDYFKNDQPAGSSRQWLEDCVSALRVWQPLEKKEGKRA
jgi:hypothetical protein